MASCFVEPLVRLSNTFNAMDLLLQETTATLKSGQETAFILTSLQAHTGRLFDLNDAICHELSSQKAGWKEHQKDLQATAECKLLLNLREACIDATAAHMAEVSAILQRMAAMPESELSESSAKDLFLLLWTSTGTVCGWPMKWTQQGAPLLPFTTHELSVWVPMFTDFNTWLLCFIRQPSLGMDLLKDCGKRPIIDRQLAPESEIPTETNLMISDWREPLFKCLDLTVVHLWNLVMSPNTQLCKTMQQFPPKFISILCCLACELFPFRHISNNGKEGSGTSQSALCGEHRQRLGTLILVIGRAVDAQATIQSGVLIHSDLTSEAVLEANRLMISCFAKDQSGSLELYRMHLHNLDVIMASRGARMSGSGLCSDKDLEAASLTGTVPGQPEGATVSDSNSHVPQPLSPGHLSAGDSCIVTYGSYVPEILTSESRVLQTLLALSAAHPSFQDLSTCIMEIAKRTWGLLSVPGHDDSDILVCLPILVQHCSLHVGRILPEAQLRLLFLAIFTLKTADEFPQALLLPVELVDLRKVKLLLLGTMTAIFKRICAEPAVALQLDLGQRQNLEGQAPFERSIPVWGPLDAFHHLPDCLLLLELAVRQGNESRILDKAISGCSVVSTHLLIQMTCMSTSAFLNHDSLCATINKVLQLAANMGEPLCREGQSSDQALLDRGRRSLAAALMSLLARYTNSLYTNSVTDDGSNLRRDTSAGGGDQQDTSSGGCRDLTGLTVGSRVQFQFEGWNFAELSSKVSNGHRYGCSNTGEHEHSVSTSVEALPLRRLAMMLVMALIRIGDQPLRQEEKKPGELGRLTLIVPNAGWVRRLLDMDAQLGGVVVAQLMSLSKLEEAPGVAPSRTCAMLVGSNQWERFASENLRGRLLPGCCHMSCTNLTGFSEASLPLQGCSGCRQARYCSVECQKAAWREGGHSKVCKKRA